MKWYAGNFIDDTGVKFYQGPWYSDGVKYEYKLVESDEAHDFCDEDQMLEWGVKPKRELKNVRINIHKRNT